MPAQRLVGDLRVVLDEIGTKVGGRAVERDAPHALRAVERGAREVGRVLGGGPRAYLDLIGRVLRAPGAGPSRRRRSWRQTPEGAGCILPPD